MNKPLPVSLFGYIHPYGVGLSFLIPIFGNKEQLLLQEIDDEGIISHFRAFTPSGDEKIVRIRSEEVRQVNDKALYGFMFSDGSTTFSTRDGLSKILKRRITEFRDYPFLKLEVLRFIAATKRIGVAVNKATKLISSLNRSVASEWRALQHPLNPFSRFVSKHVILKSIVIDSLRVKKKKLRLALISLPFFDDAILYEYQIAASNIRYIDHEASTRRIIRFSRQSSEKLYQIYKKALTTALVEHNADIVCVNELGFPAMNGEPLVKAIGFTKRLAGKCASIIVAGSYHDARTMYNTGILFFPDGQSQYVYYHKRVSSTERRELLSIPPQNQIHVVRAFGLGIAVIIGEGIMDYSAIASIVQSSRRVDILLVPSYSDRGESLSFIAKGVSEAIPGIVAINNFYHEKGQSNSIYIFGHETQPKHSVLTVAGKSLHKNALVSIFEIDSDEFLMGQMSRLDRGSSWAWLFNIIESNELH